MTTTAKPFRAGIRQAEGGYGRRIWQRRDRGGDPRWARPALAGLLAATAALYIIGLGRSGWANDFYAAAVQAGTRSWKAMFFGSFDASNFITVDKPPASLWVSEVSARIFGLNSWSLLVPQALEGVAAVGLLYATVKRWFGPGAGLLAGAVLATTPVAALMFRFNNPDALLVLLTVAAAYGVTRAIEDGRTRWLVLAGSLVGFGFLTKMLQAFLVLPAFGIAYLVAGRPRLGTRVWQLAVGGLATLLAAGWWVAIVELTPASERPYIGGSTSNSVLQLTFGYNGLGRITGNETGSVGFGTGTGSPFGGAPRLTRLFGSEMGGQASWLIPAALIALAALMWSTRRSPRTDRTRGAALVWGGWLLLTAAVFSFMAGIIHSYYTVALAPATGGLVGVGGVTAWRARRHLVARAVLAATIAVSAVWAYVLVDRSPGWYPWLRGLIVAAGLAAVIGLFAEQGVTRLGSAAVSRRTASAAAAGVMSFTLIGVLAGPVAYSLETAATPHAGAIPSAGPAVTTAAGGPGGFGGPGRLGGQAGPAGRGAGATQNGPGSQGFTGSRGVPGSPGSAAGVRGVPGGQAGAGSRPGGAGSRPGGAGGTGGAGGGPGGGLGGATQVGSAMVSLLRSGASGHRWAAAIVGATSASSLQLTSGEPIMAIGGFNGTDPAPTLAEFEKLVAAHEIRYFVASGRGSFGGSSSGASAQITSWVQKHFSSRTVAGYTVYDLSASS